MEDDEERDYCPLCGEGYPPEHPDLDEIWAQWDRLLAAGDEMARVLGNTAGVGKRELAMWREAVAVAKGQTDA